MKWYEWWTWRERLGDWAMHSEVRDRVRIAERTRDRRGGPSLRVDIRSGQQVDLVLGRYYEFGLLSGDTATGWLTELSSDRILLRNTQATYSLSLDVMHVSCVWATTDDRRP